MVSCKDDIITTLDHTMNQIKYDSTIQWNDVMDLFISLSKASTYDMIATQYSKIRIKSFFSSGGFLRSDPDPVF